MYCLLFDLQFYLDNYEYYYFSKIEPSFYKLSDNNYRKNLLKNCKNLIISNSLYTEEILKSIIKLYSGYSKLEFKSDSFIDFIDSFEFFISDKKKVLLYGKINSMETYNKFLYIKSNYPSIKYVIQTNIFKGNITPIQKKGNYIEVLYKNKNFLLKIHQNKFYFPE